uniref:Serine-threonine/tyrosine-protein kinase catalytic domain-containing protein n=1 Tax=Parascaris equorum TaxID=6256 RepID=A0A914RM83_PAREQ
LQKRLYYVYGYAFKTIPDLIAYHTRNRVNVIKFYGVAATKEPIMIVMELASGGSLLARVQDVKNPVSAVAFLLFDV